MNKTGASHPPRGVDRQAVEGADGDRAPGIEFEYVPPGGLLPPQMPLGSLSRAELEARFGSAAIHRAADPLATAREQVVRQDEGAGSRDVMREWRYYHPDEEPPASWLEWAQRTAREGLLLVPDGALSDEALKELAREGGIIEYAGQPPVFSRTGYDTRVIASRSERAGWDADREEP